MPDYHATDPDPGPPAQSLGAAARRQPRTSFYRQAWAIALNELHVRHNIVTQDISTLGVGFVSVQRFPLGSHCVLAIEFDGGERRKILCCIRRCCEIGQGFYDLGAEFEAAVVDDTGDDPIPPDWLEWAQQADHPTPHPDGTPVLEPTLIPGTCTELIPL